jgi:hypothetical protein
VLGCLKAGFCGPGCSTRTKANADCVAAFQNRDNRSAPRKLLGFPSLKMSLQLFDLLDGDNPSICRGQLWKGEGWPMLDSAAEKGQVPLLMKWSLMEIAEWAFLSGQVINLAG